MFDWRWALTRMCCWGLQRYGRGPGKFVFAVAGRVEISGRIAMAVADTTAIPAGTEVKTMVDRILDAHITGIMRLMEKDSMTKMPSSSYIDDTAPARSWKTDEIGQA